MSFLNCWISYYGLYLLNSLWVTSENTDLDRKEKLEIGKRKMITYPVIVSSGQKLFQPYFEFQMFNILPRLMCVCI